MINSRCIWENRAHFYNDTTEKKTLFFNWAKNKKLLRMHEDKQTRGKI